MTTTKKRISLKEHVSLSFHSCSLTPFHLSETPNTVCVSGLWLPAPLMLLLRMFIDLRGLCGAGSHMGIQTRVPEMEKSQLERQL